jgi:hypothetical protein
MKELYNYQEIGTLIDQGQQASFTRHIVARVTVSQPNPNVESVKAIILLSLGKYNIGIVEMTYTDIAELFLVACMACVPINRRSF